jgi:DNA-binding FrmR family transcriptional regulator
VFQKEVPMKANKDKVTRLLKTARGQMDGILKMVEEDRYCIDISQQLMATEAILNKVNKEILTAHLKCCVAHAENDEEKEEKIDELVSMLGRILK